MTEVGQYITDRRLGVLVVLYHQDSCHRSASLAARADRIDSVCRSTLTGMETARQYVARYRLHLSDGGVTGERGRGGDGLGDRASLSRPRGAVSVPSGSTSFARSRETPRDAGFRHSIAGATRPAAAGSASPNWDNSFVGCSPSTDRHRSAWSATRSPSEAPRSSASRNLSASDCCRPSCWTAARLAWTPKTSCPTSYAPEVAGTGCSAAETVRERGRQAPAAISVAEAVEAGNPSSRPPPHCRRAGPDPPASPSLS
jgi:hypothetical protein